MGACMQTGGLRALRGPSPPLLTLLGMLPTVAHLMEPAAGDVPMAARALDSNLKGQDNTA